MVQKMEIIKSEELKYHPVMKDLQSLNEEDILQSPSSKLNNKFKRIAVITIIIFFVFLYVSARLRI